MAVRQVPSVKINSVWHPPWCPVNPGIKLFWRVIDPLSPCCLAIQGVGMGEDIHPPMFVRKALIGEWGSMLEQNDPLADYPMSQSRLKAHLEKLTRQGWGLVAPESSPAYKEHRLGAGYITSEVLIWIPLTSLA